MGKRSEEYNVGTVKQIITESYSSDEEVEKMICYEAPFNKCDREDDYKIAWDYFSKKYTGEGELKCYHQFLQDNIRKA